MPELIDAVAARTEKLDILVNNAGATWGAPLDEFPAAAFDKVLTLNVKAPFLLTQLARPLLGPPPPPTTPPASSTSARSTASWCHDCPPTPTRRRRPPCTN